MALKSTPRKNIRHAKTQTRSKQLTQAEIEARLVRRANTVQEKIRRLELSQIVTQDTMRLEFQPSVSSTYIVETEKPS